MIKILFGPTQELPTKGDKVIFYSKLYVRLGIQKIYSYSDKTTIKMIEHERGTISYNK